MLEPNSAVTQLPAVYRFGFSNYTPFQVTAYSGWGYLQKHKCMRSSWLWTHSFPIELTRLRVTLTHHGFTVSVNTSARPMKSCTCRRAPFARWFHGENTWSNDAQNTTWIWWFLVLVSTTSSHLYSFSLSTAYIFFTCVSLHAPYNFYSVHSTVYLLASWMWCLLDNMLYLTCFNIPLNALGPTVV